MSLYRGMDRAELDLAYSPSSMVEDVPGALREWAVRSDAARARLGAPQTLRYGPGDAELIDLFVPAPGAVAGAAVLVFIHGGYWIEGSRQESAFLAPDLVPGGIASAALGYPLAPTAGLAEIVGSCERGVEFLLDRAGSLGLDPARIHLAGHSAGAHLATMVATGRLAGRIAGVVAVSGVFDLEPIALSYPGEPLGLDSAGVLRNSPLHRLRPGLPPLVVAHGQWDTAEFIRQSEEFAEAWQQAGDAAVLVPVPGTHHFDVVLGCADPDTVLGRAVLAQITARSTGESDR